MGLREPLQVEMDLGVWMLRAHPGLPSGTAGGLSSLAHSQRPCRENWATWSFGRLAAWQGWVQTPAGSLCKTSVPGATPLGQLQPPTASRAQTGPLWSVGRRDGGWPQGATSMLLSHPPWTH